MSEIITAVYEKGLLRPMTPLNLCENQTVRIQVLPAEPTDEEIVQILISAGLLRQIPSRGPVPPDPVSAQERQELAEILGRAAGKSLSQTVIEERGPR